MTSNTVEFGRTYRAPKLGVINSWSQHPNMVHSESLVAKATQVVFLHGQVKKVLTTQLAKKDPYGNKIELHSLMVAIDTPQAEALEKSGVLPSSLFQPTNPENGKKGAFRIKLNLKPSTIWTGLGADPRDPHRAMVKFGALEHLAHEMWPLRTYDAKTKEWKGGPEWCHFFVVHIGEPKTVTNKQGEEVLYDNLTVLGMSGRIPYQTYKAMVGHTDVDPVACIEKMLIVDPPNRYDGDDQMIVDTETENPDEVRVMYLVPFDPCVAQKIYL